MNQKRALILILILFTSLFPLIPIPIAKADELVVSVSHTYDDVWMTEAGNIFSNTFMVMMLDNEIGIHAFLRFQNLTISKSAKINYATLKVYVAETQETPDPGSSVTIYGIDEPDCAPFTSDGSLWSLSRPYTSASVNWNTTEWSGYRSVNVTDIVKEIINQYAWSSGNDLGLQILGASDSGHWPRSFEDYYHAYHEGQAQLTIVYDVAPDIPDGLPDDAVFEETYGEYDIWSVPGEAGGLGYPLEPMEYVFIEGTASPYSLKYDDLVGSGPYNIAPSEDGYATRWQGQRKLVRLNDGTMNVVYKRELAGKNQIYVQKSTDNGTTWTDEIRISTYAGMESSDQRGPAMAVDSNDYLQVVWFGAATGFTPEFQIWYINYTDSWSTPLRISTYTGMEDEYQGYPCIAVDSNDYLHILWSGSATGYTKSEIWYTTYTGTWTSPVRINTYTNMDDYLSQNPSIAVDSDDNLHTVFESGAQGFVEQQVWYATATSPYEVGEWITPLRISTYTGMEIYDTYIPVIALGSDDDIHVIWYSKALGFSVYTQIWYATATSPYEVGDWITPLRISNYTGMSGYSQSSSSIALESDDDVHVIWAGKSTEYLDENKIWHSSYNGSWSTANVLQPIGRNQAPSLRWGRWPEAEEAEEDTFYLVDENNTVIETWNGDNFTDIDDLKDWTDDYVDPEGGDPLDPDPGTQGWDTEGPFTRFKMRLYFLFLGLGCLFVPLWAMAYKKLDAVGYAGCFIIIVLGVGLLWSITGI